MMILVLLVHWALSNAPAYGQPAVSDEYLVKSAFLYNFAKFIKWPKNAFPDDNAPMVFGVLGKDPFGSHLDLLEKKTVNGRPIVVRRAKSIEQLLHCQVLYISPSEGADLGPVLAGVKGLPILTVSDIPEAACHGGVIGLYKSQSKIRFAIDLRAAGASGLKVSSQLMKLSRVCGGK